MKQLKAYFFNFIYLILAQLIILSEEMFEVGSFVINKMNKTKLFFIVKLWFPNQNNQNSVELIFDC